MILGFTGTQVGMTRAQARTVRRILRELKPEAVVHGDCVGADDDFDEIVADAPILRIFRPSTIESKRARGHSRRSGRGGAIVLPPEPPLVRNKKIIAEANELLACPKTVREMRRSGTWTTVRQAVKAGKRVTIVYPDGMTSSR